MNFPRRRTWGGGFKKKENVSDDNHYTSINIYLPRKFFEVLQKHSEEMQLPISRLICYAIDNELDALAPFNYMALDPTTEYVPDAYIEEAGKILRFIQDFPNGIGRDALMLFRRTIGIPNKTTFMLALRELFKAEMVVETVRKPVHNKFNYSPFYKFIRLKNSIPAAKVFDREKKKILEAEAKLEERKKKLEQKKQKYGVEEWSRLHARQNAQIVKPYGQWASILTTTLLNGPTTFIYLVLRVILKILNTELRNDSRRA